MSEVGYSDIELDQTPTAGDRMLRFCGDALKISLRLNRACPGRAYLRTNLGNASLRRREIIDAVERDCPRLETDWHDHSMERVTDTEFVLHTSLDQVGIFEAKTFFAPADSNDLFWPAGDNILIKVEPASLAAGNTIYTAFIRQFGINKSSATGNGWDEEQAVKMEDNGYTVIPPSGKFRDLIDELDLIICEMGFRFIQLLPIHPVPTTYARMGRFGSPFAALDFFNVDRSLAIFDGTTTPLEQFQELVQEVHRRDGRIILDIALNHTGWASQLQIHHPEWFPRNPDGTFRSPSAWGVVWEDLSELDYSHRSLWRYVAEVFLYWCSKGVDGFRCDAGYMIPFEVWEYVVAKVRNIYPETVFLLEGLGGKVSVTRNLLSEAGLNWAYSEIFQNYNRNELEGYLPRSFEIENTDGLLAAFAETHDNNRLAESGKAYARMRTALCALTSQSGAFAITNGVEWYADAKIDVHGAPPLNWGAEDNMVEWIALLNAIVSTHPAFQAGSSRRLIQEGDGNSLALLREGRRGEIALVLINLSAQNSEPVNWTQPANLYDKPLFDALNHNARIEINLIDGRVRYDLKPAQVSCLLCDKWVATHAESRQRFSSALDKMRYRTKYLEALRASRNGSEPAPAFTDEELQAFIDDPRSALGEMSGSDAPIHVDLELPRDLRRTVMVPPAHFLIISSSTAFMATELRDREPIYSDRSLPASNGVHILIIPPAQNVAAAERRSIEFHMFREIDVGPDIVSSPILRLPPYPLARVANTWSRGELEDPNLCALMVNDHSTVSYVRAAWSKIRSQYDALLAVNPSESYPDDRRILWTRCRCWVVYKDYSREVALDSLIDFSAGAVAPVRWRFAIPVGSGMTIPLLIELRLDRGKNLLVLNFNRAEALDGNPYPLLDPDQTVRLVVRPDLEDRNFHGKTKAFIGPEGRFAEAIEDVDNGFVFKPYDLSLQMTFEDGTAEFVAEPEWQYMVQHPIDGERGLDDRSDLFSPGYFSVDLRAGESLKLRGEILTDGLHAEKERAASKPYPSQEFSQNELIDLAQAAGRACLDFIVRRNSGHTVIAGYPWFLDWGRDTLIALRGIIAAGHHQLALEILLEFARFERDGTLPNMIHGDDASNRDTSDAPLWFIVACRELNEAAHDLELLDRDCAGRPLRAIIESIAVNYCSGTPNGIAVDADAGLVFSPEHFTWMDTQHPAGTPRSGYPIEIQALWSAALEFLEKISVSEPQRWSQLRVKVNQSITELYPLPAGGLSDCLHCQSPDIPARAASADDHCRPNQLFAITLVDILPHATAASVLQACSRLLVPGAIRTLDDAPVKQALPVREPGGVLLNDPQNPYWGHYSGDEDTRRKPAYHNGTAWTWPFPSYCEALVKVYGEDAKPTALALLGSAAQLFDQGCAGHLPEILDGDTPHIQRGCTAQAWSVTELLRVISQIA